MDSYTKAEQLLLDIYDYSLADNGDRGLFPCKQIGDYFKSKGIDIREEDWWNNTALKSIYPKKIYMTCKEVGSLIGIGTLNKMTM